MEVGPGRGFLEAGFDGRGRVLGFDARGEVVKGVNGFRSMGRRGDRSLY